jgi:energy-converting hydrogenase Eha subunit A
MRFLMRHIPDVIAAGLGLLVLLSVAVWLYKRSAVQSRAWLKRAVVAGWALGSLLVFGGLAFRSTRIANQFPTELVRWVGTASLVLVISLVIASAAIAVARLIPRPSRSHSPARRSFLTAARGAVFATPIAAAGYAVFVERSNINGREVELPVAGLPKELNGLRIAQLSDIHLSPFLSEQELARAVDMANEFRPHLAVVTGDLITSSTDPLDACLGQLGRLRSEAGTLGCHGNHEIYAGAEDYATRHGRKAGIEFLRSASRELKFGGQSINFAGVDGQRMKDASRVGEGR